MKVFLNHRLLDESKARVSVFDHGFLYGDGVYETVRAYDGRVFRWEEHSRRLRQSARRIALRCPWSSAELLQAVRKVLRANHQPDASVRITLSRGPGPLGLDPEQCPRPTLAILLHPYRALEALWKTGISIGIVRVRRNHPDCLDPQIKSNNSLNTILAKIEAQRMKVFEGILTNLDGDLAEGTISNLFYVRKGCLYTPALSGGLLEGITRRIILQLARQMKLPVREGRCRPPDLQKAQEIFISSTTLEVMPVISVAQYKESRGTAIRRFRVGAGCPGPVARELHRRLRLQIARELKLPRPTSFPPVVGGESILPSLV
ncbi:MAG: aminotransferase class IV [Elusimicrobiota bacterium]